MTEFLAHDGRPIVRCTIATWGVVIGGIGDGDAADYERRVLVARLYDATCSDQFRWRMFRSHLPASTFYLNEMNRLFPAYHWVLELGTGDAGE